MLEISNLRLPLDAGLPRGEDCVRKALARACGVAHADVGALRLLKRSVDARKKSDVHFVATYAFELRGGQAAEEGVLARGVKAPLHAKRHEPAHAYRPPALSRLLPKRPVVVGTGPAGLFCAWALAQAGARPIVLERGACVEERMVDVEAFNAGGPLDPESNIQFGEGGAGTFSDGKLTTNIKNPRCKDVLHIFAQAGAPEEILWQAKPHIGTDMLVDVVRVLRRQIIDAGGEVRFGTRLDGVRFEGGRVAGVTVSCSNAPGASGAECAPVAQGVQVGTCDAGGDVSSEPIAGEGRTGSSARVRYEIETDDVVLACGHSARDTFAMVRDAGLLMERKPFSVGVRIEHPQVLINEAQYGAAAAHPALGAADYKLAVHLPGGRGVYTFCMCPGGEVVAAASEEGGVCVNGMSRFARDGENANSAVLVGVDESDLPGDDVLAGVELQRTMESAAYAAAGSTYAAPAQRVGDFLTCGAGAKVGLDEKALAAQAAKDACRQAAGDSCEADRHEGGCGGSRASQPSDACADDAPRPTYARGVVWCDLHEVLPAFVAESLAEALPLLDRRLHGFAHPNAVMTGVETRSSSPVRIVRDKQTLQAFFAQGAECSGDACGADGARDAGDVRHAGKSCAGLYPCGEGAGYAGGIMSAAVDGLRVAEALLERAGR